MDELERLRKEAADAIAQGADPEKVRHEFRRLAALLPEPQDAPETNQGAGSTLGAFGRSVLATAANAAQGIPGMEALQSGVRSLVRGQSFADARSDIRGETGKIPGALRVAGQIPGAIASTAIPGVRGLGVASQGAAYGGASQALSADDQSLGERAGRTAVGAAAGAFIPKAIQGVANTGRIAATGVRSIGATSPAKLLQGQEAKLQAETGPMYERALQEGRGAVVPPQVRAFLDRPEIRDISARLQQLDRYKGMADDSPEMIQAIDRALTDQSIALRNPANMVAQGKGATNVGRAELDQVRSLKGDLATSTSTPGRMMGPSRGGSVTTPPMMPSQRAANQAFAKGKGEQEATKRGVNAVAAAERGRSAGSTLNKSSPEAFEAWVSKASDAEKDAFMKSVLGETGNKVRGSIKPDAMTAALGLGGFALGGPSGLAGAAVPALIRAGKAATAGDRMLRAAKGKPRGYNLPRGVTPTILDMLNEATRR